MGCMEKTLAAHGQSLPIFADYVHVEWYNAAKTTSMCFCPAGNVLVTSNENLEQPEKCDGTIVCPSAFDWLYWF